MNPTRKRTLIRMSIMLVLSAVVIILIQYDVFTPKCSYVRLKDGTEFHNVKVRWPSDVDVVIDGKYYTEYDIDSLAR